MPSHAKDNANAHSRILFRIRPRREKGFPFTLSRPSRANSSPSVHKPKITSVTKGHRCHMSNGTHQKLQRSIPIAPANIVHEAMPQ